MPDNSSDKKGLFGWFGKKKKQNDTDFKHQLNESSLSESAQNEQEQELSTPRVSAEEVSLKEPLEQEQNLLDQVSEKTEKEAETNGISNSEMANNSVSEESVSRESVAEPSGSFFQRLKKGLSKTRTQFSNGLADLVLGQKEIDEDLLEEVETLLLLADVGVDTTTRIINDLTQKAARKELKDTQALKARLKELLLEIIEPVQVPLVIPKQDVPFVILMVGVNGVGKTTTIGKMAHQFIADGKSVMLAAGDTFRAAAVEQLKTWGERNQVPVIAQHTGADSASVIFDAVEAAKAKKIDIVIADTAGRLHNKSHLMEELNKVKRVMGKIDIGAPHEVMLVVDAGTGQNALVQAVEFNKVVALDSVTITKLDGTAKGGVVFALADKMKLPIRYIGVGESKLDLRIFNANDYIDALFEQ